MHFAASKAKQDVRFAINCAIRQARRPVNLVEGFGYYDHPEFAKHVRIAKASLDETHNHLRDGVDRGFWSEGRIAPLLQRASDAAGKCVKLAQDLSNTEAPGSWRKPKHRRGRRTSHVAPST